MDYLDPKKQKEHLIRLIIGYILVATALVLLTTILLYRAYGFGLKNGEVIQNGLIFVSSRPTGAEVYINGKKRPETTNDRFLMSAGQYTFELKRKGYDSWKRAINVEGGAVVRFDYPVLFPSKLTTETVKRYEVQPPLVLQSPNRRWLLLQNPSSLASFEQHDLTKTDDTTTTITVPDTSISLRDGLQRWSQVEWSSDSRHVLLLHTAEKDGTISSEYILLDRDTPSASRNLTKDLNAGIAAISLRNKADDTYFLYDAAAKTLSTTSLDAPTPVKYQEGVLAFKAYGDDSILYVTAEGAPEGKAWFKLRKDDATYNIRQVTLGDTYMLDVAAYRNNVYVVAGAPAENRTYIYKEPIAALKAHPKLPLVPVQVLKASAPQYVAFSENGRFVMEQGGQQVGVYDTENDRGYAYQLDVTLDEPQTHLAWMDGHRLMAVEKGKVRVFDFDNINGHTLAPASAAFLPLFDNDFKHLYTIATQAVKAADGTDTMQYELHRTSLLTVADQ